MKQNEIRCKSSEDKKLVGSEQMFAYLPFQKSILKLNESLDKSSKIYNKFIKRDESHQRTRRHPGIEHTIL